MLEQALSHRSVSAKNYERLEFLGDGLINFVVAELVYRQRAGAEEGELSRLRAALVREEALARVAQGLNLGEALRLGGGELKSGGHRRESILADALEALLGAAYLDAGFEAARTLALRLFEPLLAQLPPQAMLKDAKTRLQEWLQSRGRALPEYRLIETQGPSHQQVFTVACVLDDARQRSQGEGGSRKLAEQQAAERLLLELERADA